MKVKLSGLIRFEKLLSLMAVGERAPAGVLMQLVNDNTQLCLTYNANTKMARVAMDVEGLSEEEQGFVGNKVFLLDFKRLKDSLKDIKGDSVIEPMSVSITFEGENIMVLGIQKGIRDGEALKEVSFIKHKLLCEDAATNSRGQYLLKVDYEKFYHRDDKERTFMVKSAELSKLLGSLCFEQNKAAYISPKLKEAFVVTGFYVYKRQIPDEITNPMVLNTLYGSWIEEALKGADDDYLHVTVLADNGGYVFCTDDNSFLIYIAVGTGNETHIKLLDTYKGMEFKKQVNLSSAVLKSFLNSIAMHYELSVAKNTVTLAGNARNGIWGLNVIFGKEVDKAESGYFVACTGDTDWLKDFKVSLNGALLRDMLGNMEGFDMVLGLTEPMDRGYIGLKMESGDVCMYTTIVG